MAVDLVRSSTQFLEYGSAVASSPPFTMSIWANPDDVLSAGQYACMMALGNLAGWNIHGLTIGKSEGSKVVAWTHHPTGTEGLAWSTAAVTYGSWNHVCGVWSATNSRAVYLNGGNSGTNTTDLTITVDRTSLGRYAAPGGGDHFDGRIAEAAIWSAVLTAKEIDALAVGMCPLRIRPASLAGYWPLGGLYSRSGADRWKNRYDMTASGSPTYVDHCRVIYPPRPRLAIRQAAASGAGETCITFIAG